MSELDDIPIGLLLKIEFVFNAPDDSTSPRPPLLVSSKVQLSTLPATVRQEAKTKHTINQATSWQYIEKAEGNDL